MYVSSSHMYVCILLLHQLASAIPCLPEDQKYYSSDRSIADHRMRLYEESMSSLCWAGILLPYVCMYVSSSFIYKSMSHHNINLCACVGQPRCSQTQTSSSRPLQHASVGGSASMRRTSRLRELQVSAHCLRVPYTRCAVHSDEKDLGAP